MCVRSASGSELDHLLWLLSGLPSTCHLVKGFKRAWKMTQVVQAYVQERQKGSRGSKELSDGRRLWLRHN